jgi:hypothetical protein
MLRHEIVNLITAINLRPDAPSDAWFDRLVARLEKLLEP